jgi:hypothetical protein
MKQKLSRNPLVFAIVLLSFAWNAFLLIGVVLNLDFVHTRAAGGQFTDFPTGIRIIYVLQLALVAYQVWIFKLIFHSYSVKPNWIPKLFFTLGILGILANAASRSANERWNVIPAAIITWSFWYYGIKREMKSP